MFKDVPWNLVLFQTGKCLEFPVLKKKKKNLYKNFTRIFPESFRAPFLGLFTINLFGFILLSFWRLLQKAVPTLPSLPSRGHGRRVDGAQAAVTCVTKNVGSKPETF